MLNVCDFTCYCARYSKVLQEVPWLNKSCRAGLCKETTGYCTSQPAKGTLRTLRCGVRSHVRWNKIRNEQPSERGFEVRAGRDGGASAPVTSVGIKLSISFNGFGIFRFASSLRPFVWRLMLFDV